MTDDIDPLSEAKRLARRPTVGPLNPAYAQAYALIAIAEELREWNAREWEKRQ